MSRLYSSSNFSFDRSVRAHFNKKKFGLASCITQLNDGGRQGKGGRVEPDRAQGARVSGAGGGQVGVPTLAIAKHIGGPHASKQTVNATLYALQKRLIIQKTAEPNGANPQWRMPPKQTK